MSLHTSMCIQDLWSTLPAHMVALPHCLQVSYSTTAHKDSEENEQGSFGGTPAEIADGE